MFKPFSSPYILAIFILSQKENVEARQQEMLYLHQEIVRIRVDI